MPEELEETVLSISASVYMYLQYSFARSAGECVAGRENRSPGLTLSRESSGREELGRRQLQLEKQFGGCDSPATASVYWR